MHILYCNTCNYLLALNPGVQHQQLARLNLSDTIRQSIANCMLQSSLQVALAYSEHQIVHKEPPCFDTE